MATFSVSRSVVKNKANIKSYSVERSVVKNKAAV